MRWISQGQNTVEVSKYGSELLASIIATGLILEVRYMLWSLGVSLDGSVLMLGDDMSVVLNTTLPSSILKKKHDAIQVIKAIAARIMRFSYIKSDEIVSDMLKNLQVMRNSII
jgi:hypothetical protein